jgi:hypothetical protein
MKAKVKASTYNYKVANIKGNTTRHYAASTAIHATHMALQARQANLLPSSPSETPLAQEHSFT